MKLRQWQEDCIQQALESFHIRRHFLCLATPGAGKTIMSAALSRQLLEQNRIDLVLCFSPSVVTVQGVQETFSSVIGQRFDGKVGAIGGSYTYQSMLFLRDDFWSTLEHNRVLVIFDEIHHCSGSDIGSANAWGEKILLQVSEKAEFTLALTGTPWRSDCAPVVLSNYVDSQTQIYCDFVYGLKEAVQEGVCRAPKIILVDNDSVSVSTQENQSTFYVSLRDMLTHEKALSYRHILSDDAAINDVLARGCQRLMEVRRYNPRAGGLVVASSTKHAAHIHRVLERKFGQTSVLVTYKEVNAAQKINQYRKSDTAWIVSVGMISEGTDIPRLQVCCHLSRVRTELYFRQVLGRILRVDDSKSREAWLYTFAETNLIEFANRLEQEIPELQVVIRATLTSSNKEQSWDKVSVPEDVPYGLDRIEWSASQERTNGALYLEQHQIGELNTFQFLGKFREKIVDVFDERGKSLVGGNEV